jgi:hypothetical protein
MLAALSFGQASAQTQPAAGVDDCRPSALDTNVQMPDPSASDASIVFYFKNIGNLPCAFSQALEVGGPLQSRPSLTAPGADFGTDANIWSCTLCLIPGKPDPPGFRLARRIVVPPAGTAEGVVEFNSAPDCPAVGWLLVTPQLTVLPGPPHACQPMRVSSFRLMAPDGPGSPDTTGSVAPKSLTLSSDLETLFTGSAIRLRLERDDVGSPKALAAPLPRCPSLFLRFRDKDGFTRVEHLFEVQNYGDCPREQKAPNGQLASTVSWGYYPEKDFTLDITQEFDAGQGKVARVRSNAIAFKVIDPKTVQRTWGPRLNGLAANVTLDRRSYEIGQAIPLHIATAVFADNSGRFWGIKRLPEQGITISIVDAPK